MEQSETSESLIPVSETYFYTSISLTKPAKDALIRSIINNIHFMRTVTNGICQTLEGAWRIVPDIEKEITDKTSSTQLKSIEHKPKYHSEPKLSQKSETKLDKKIPEETRRAETEASDSGTSSFASTSGKICAFSESRAAVDNALGVILDGILKLQQTVEADRKNALERKRKLDSIIEESITLFRSAQQDMRDDGKLIWKINDVSKRKQRESKDPKYEGLFSERFQTPEGYQFRMCVFLNGTGQGKSSHISVFIQLCRTDYDDVLVYPFKGHCSITLYDQNTNPVRSKKEHYTVKFKSNNSRCFQKPAVENNPENGVAEFVSHDFLVQHESEEACEDKKPVYLCRDTIFIGAEVKCSVNRIERFFTSTRSNTTRSNRIESSNAPFDSDFQRESGETTTVQSI